MALDAESLAQFTDTVARFVRERLIPAEAQVAADDRIPDDLLRGMGELGLFGMTLPEQFGGLNLNASEEVRVVFELCYAAPAFRGYLGANNGLGGRAILVGGSEPMKDKYLTGIASGEIVTAFALTEPETGSDAAALKTKATKQADGSWVLSGRKTYITHADIADVFIVVARSDPQSVGGKGVSVFLVPGDTPGLARGKPEKKMGQQGTHVADLSFNDCVLPASALLGVEGRGFELTMQGIDRSRLHMGAICVGVARRLIDESLKYAMERRQFGKPIAEFQLVQAMLADSQAEMAAARALVIDSAARCDAGENISMEASCCKMFASEMVGRVADRAVQIFGGAGYMQDSVVERLYRDVRVFRIYEGTTQIQQVTIAKHMIRRATAG
ncbi:acyl-CoA dehydrogenase family protein [Caenimonas sp. SL110]|uniref:acyl-CoA dehydrogenase family protein n=1 Tax=Caenimonas sp. SL110 TaxID=1450524 RepID=UPI0006529651|nr:acyl-CoA dehydrogenase family protein [Caenimonas sp. SL110]